MKKLNLLAIDTSSNNISFSILFEGKIINYNNHNLKASNILSPLDKYIKKFSIDLKKIDCFVVGRGPGSFMGLRISHSIIKAFSLSLDKPIIALGSFFSMAYPFKRYKKIAVVADARRNLVYAGTFKVKDDNLYLEEKEKLYNLKDFIDKRRDYFFVTYSENIIKQAKDIQPDLVFYPKIVFPKAYNLLKIAIPYYLKGKFSPIEIEPLYIYPKTCQIKKRDV